METTSELLMKRRERREVHRQGSDEDKTRIVKARVRAVP